MREESLCCDQQQQLLWSDSPSCCVAHLPSSLWLLRLKTLPGLEEEWAAGDGRGVRPRRRRSLHRCSTGGGGSCCGDLPLRRRSGVAINVSPWSRRGCGRNHQQKAAAAVARWWRRSSIDRSSSGDAGPGDDNGDGRRRSSSRKWSPFRQGSSLSVAIVCIDRTPLTPGITLRHATLGLLAIFVWPFVHMGSHFVADHIPTQQTVANEASANTNSSLRHMAERTTSDGASVLDSVIEQSSTNLRSERHFHLGMVYAGEWPGAPRHAGQPR